jgi:branched-chain amino acid transport system permease protein
MNRYALPAAVLLAAVAVPNFAGDYWTAVGIGIITFAILGLGLNVVVGYAGLLDLGYAAFFAIGAYTAALLMTRAGFNYWETLPFSILFAAGSGVVIGYPTLRLRSDYLAIVTLGFGEIIRITATNLDYTGGPDGIWAIPQPSIFGFVLSSQRALYYLALAILLVTLLFVRRLAYSRLGRAWMSLREDESAAEATGVPVVRVKLLAYVMGAICAGVAGGFFATRLSVVNPQSFTFLQSVQVLIVVVLGGMGSIPGVLLGAAIVVALPELLRSIADWRMFTFSIALIALMLIRPQGLWPVREQRVAPRPKALPPLPEVLARLGSAALPRGVARLGDAAHKPVLVVNDLRVSFGGLTAVNDVSFETIPGEILSIIGPNGAGKTTVFNAIMGVVHAQAGTVTLNGRPLLGLTPHEVVHAGLARTFQGIRLFRQMAVHHNVLVGMHARLRAGVLSALLGMPGARREERTAAAAAHSCLDFLGLGDKAALAAGALSYGDQRRLEIARALASAPGVLLLDEPAAGMNPSEKQSLMALIKRVRDLGITVILIEHDMALVMQISDRVIVLNRGQVIASGTPGEVQDDQSVIDAYLGREEDEPAAAEMAVGTA